MPADAIWIRPAAPADAPRLAAISAAEYDSWSAEDFLATLDNPCARVFTAADPDGCALGYAVLYFDADGSELIQIAVDSAFRRQHIATALMEEVFSFLRENEIPQVMLEVRALNGPASAFYRKTGFEITHITRDFYRNPPDDAVKMLRRV